MPTILKMINQIVANHYKITFRNCQSRRPFRLENVQTNISIVTYIWMENFCFERDLWRFKRIFCRELNIQVKHSSLIWRIWRSRNCSLPSKEVFSDRTCTTQSWRLTSKVKKLLKYIVELYYLTIINQSVIHIRNSRFRGLGYRSK